MRKDGMVSNILIVTLLVLLAGCCRCGIPLYGPSYWNDSGIVQGNNNCYNYGNNKKTNTFAQPGRRAGAQYTSLACTSVYNAALADGLTAASAGGTCPRSYCIKDKVALVVAPGIDYHWYRQDNTGMWSHKPGNGLATNLDNSYHSISDPRTADRGAYTEFCGFLCSCSSSSQGEGYENIN